MGDFDKAAAYERALAQISAIMPSCRDEIAAMSSIVAVLHNSFEYFYWTGFYRVVEHGIMAVGPFQGTPACVEIAFERGVCGHCATTRKAVVVDDVHEFPGHIACDSKSASEIVIPVFGEGGRLTAVLDIDSDRRSAFDETDLQYLEGICRLLSK